MVGSAPAMGETAWPCRCLAPQLVPSWTSSERTFEQSVSPSPHGKRARLGAPRVWAGENGDRSDRTLHPIASRVRPPSTSTSRRDKRASLEGASGIGIASQEAGRI